MSFGVVFEVEGAPLQQLALALHVVADGLGARVFVRLLLVNVDMDQVGQPSLLTSRQAAVAQVAQPLQAVRIDSWSLKYKMSH